ncbi:cupin domain-containing protein [Tersicoccus sp. MR15.9]|uniref:cupin domain-containing protein n=1 Tax=Tersicoccus mangrovi TaxID=3121635 RepID=UPI002FE5EFA0
MTSSPPRNTAELKGQGPRTTLVNPRLPGHNHRMVDVGAEMSNPRSGERFVWRATHDSTGGEYCEFDLHLDSGAKVALAHRHPFQEERFTVVSGALDLTNGRERSTVTAGQAVAIPPNTPHRWGNAGTEASHVRVRLTPALEIEDYFAAFCAVATAGRAVRSGLPRNPFQFAVMAHAHRAEFTLPSEALQRVFGPVVGVLAPIGSRLGYRSDGLGR